MGRKSALTPEQWAEVERRHIVNGESLNSLAKQLGLNESSLRKKIGRKLNEQESVRDELRDLAARKARADRDMKSVTKEIQALPVVRQMIVTDLARKLSAISEHLSSAGEHAASASHRLMAMARDQIDKIDEVDPKKSREAIEAVVALTRMANDAAHIPLNLLKANQETVNAMNKPQEESVPAGLAHFYGE